MTTIDILISVLENQKKLCCQNTEMHLELICEQLIYTYGINATYSGKSIYIDDKRVASIQTSKQPCAETKNCVGIEKYKIL